MGRVVSRWDAVVRRALALPEDLLHERVDGEWSFIETLRHLVFATDAWVLRAALLRRSRAPATTRATNSNRPSSGETSRPSLIVPELVALFDELAELADVRMLPIAIERGEGLVVGLIAGAGHPVLMAEPAAFKAARPRWGLAGAKSDLGD